MGQTDILFSCCDSISLIQYLQKDCKIFYLNLLIRKWKNGKFGDTLNDKVPKIQKLLMMRRDTNLYACIHTYMKRGCFILKKNNQIHRTKDMRNIWRKIRKIWMWAMWQLAATCVLGFLGLIIAIKFYMPKSLRCKCHNICDLKLFRVACAEGLWGRERHVVEGRGR